MQNKIKSTVKSVQANGTFDSNYGLLYKFDYEFEDGASLAANHKTQNHFKVGETIEYFIKGSNDYGNYGTVGKPQEQFQQGGKSDKVQTYIIRQSSLTRAIEYLGQQASKEDITEMADYFTKWVLNE